MGSVVSSFHCMNDPQPEGSHGKPHRTTKILSHTRRRGGLAVRGARAAAGYAGERAEWHKLEGKSPVGQSHAELFFRSGCERLLNHAVNVSDFADIASTSCCAAEALQAFALSMLSKAMTTNRLGGVPIAPWGWAG